MHCRNERYELWKWKKRIVRMKDVDYENKISNCDR